MYHTCSGTDLGNKLRGGDFLWIISLDTTLLIKLISYNKLCLRSGQIGPTYGLWLAELVKR